ncbi:hypothetical protein ES332_D11G047500v1 [Gossypium tomentosum]|uniref:Uncharacterized protein n=1 Tax=Gossypium tomentosum TaxID=34277 RepID=A0A5D2IHY5_GOSTO|nr:hypothetical protein ES332_D11G047500v1 [Gossypium tomentosum]
MSLCRVVFDARISPIRPRTTDPKPIWNFFVKSCIKLNRHPRAPFSFSVASILI